MQSNGLIKQVMSLSSLKVWIRSPLLSSTTTAYYYNVFLFVVIICQLSVDICGETSDDNAKPNFVILIADDLGIGDVSSFGNTSLNTANIDRIGNEGALLTHHLTAASVCTPSRSAFLTGRYPIRTGMASAARNRVFLFVAAKGGLPTNETTFAKTLQQNNYGTALIGKWHLGNDCDALGDACHHPLNHGFDHFYGLPLTNLKDFGNDGASVVKSYFPQFTALLATIAAIGLTLAFITFAKKYHKLSLLIIIFLIIVPMLALVVQKSIKTINSVLMRGTQVIEQPIQLEGITDRLVNEAQEFIVNQTVQNKPFLVVLNFVKVHSAHFPSNPFKGKSGYGKYGDCVLEMDSGVGRILDFLKNNNLRDNTFVYFSSDNGGHLEEVGIDGEKEGGYNGLFKGGKGHGAMEGGIRVPTAIMWPNKIPAKTVISVPTSQMDIYTTIHKITNIPVPSDRIIDGKNILSLLLQPKTATDASQHKFLFHYCGTYLHGVRYMEDRDHIWKLYFYRPKFRSTGEYKCQFMCMCFEPHVVLYDPPLVFNLANDPYEDYPLDVLSNERHSLIVKEIARAIEAHDHTVDRVPSQFDFWQSVWRPWLQPCCQLPNCRCSEPVRTQQHKIMKK